MGWLALQLTVGAAHAEALADALLECGAYAVTTEDADAGAAWEAARYAGPEAPPPGVWRRNRLTALAARDTDAAALVAAAASSVGLAPAPRVSAQPVEDDDWVRRSQSQFGPVRAGARLWIVPHWCEVPRDPEAVVVRLDPGIAFGTGSHPSTRLVLAWLERTLRVGERVLDYGCGSGILALAAARLGAGEVVAVDLDPQALQAAAVNARANGIALRTSAPEMLGAEAFDVVVANILARPLISLAPQFAARTRRGGRLALSGILRAQRKEVLAAFAPCFALHADTNEEGWVLLEGIRR
jgi:ribosomal protein L11 methyltransferase